MATLLPSLLPRQNLVKQVAPEEYVRPPGFYTAFAFEFLSILAGIAVGYVYRNYLWNGGSLTGLFIVAGVFGIISNITLLGTKSIKRRVIMAFLEMLTITVFFIGFPGTTYLYLAEVLLAALLFRIWGEFQSHRERDNMLEVRFLRVVRPALGKLISALVLIGVLIHLPQWKEEGQFVSPQTFEEFFTSSMQIAAKVYPQFGGDPTIRSFASGVAESQLEGNAQFGKLNPAGQAQAIARAADEILKQLKERFKINVTGEEKLSNAFYGFFEDSLKTWHEKSSDLFLFFWVALVFFIFRGFGVVLYIGVAFAGFLVYQLLLALNVIHVIGESRMHETIEFS